MAAVDLPPHYVDACVFEDGVVTHGGESGGMLVKERSCVSGGIWNLNRGCGKCLRRLLSGFRQEVDAEG